MLAIADPIDHYGRHTARAVRKQLWVLAIRATVTDARVRPHNQLNFSTNIADAHCPATGGLISAPLTTLTYNQGMLTTLSPTPVEAIAGYGHSAAEQSYRHIWSQVRERQNRASSSWWFFLLFPEGADGYGPRQLMFTIASRAGRQINISGLEMPGIDLNRPVSATSDQFHAAAVGWYCDGRQVHEGYVKETALAQLSYDDSTLSCLTDGPSGDRYGINFARSDTYPLAIQADIAGRDQRASFTAWGDLDAPYTSPNKSMDIQTAFGGVHYIALRKLNFDGVFELPTGRERLKGLGFFQRVAMNFPVFPWKWIYALFPDGSMFTGYIPYVGFNLTRKGYKFFGSNRAEQAALPVTQSAFFFPSGTTEPIRFSRVVARPVLNRGPHPQFEVEAHNRQGDTFSFLAASYGHARFSIDRPVLGGLTHSHWTYNEYIFRMEQLRGQVAGREINRQTMGQGFGNMEYTWGLGL